MEFKTYDNVTCQVLFYFEGFTGTSTDILPANKPFTLKEFNTDEDLFKPIRPQMAEINILGSSTIGIDNFLANNDSDIEVRFNYSGSLYWVGNLLQDDYQETWNNTYHVLTLKASENFGYLKEIEIQDNNGNELVGIFTPFSYIQYAMWETSASLLRFKIINNLFHESMTPATDYHPLSSCYIDAKTFQIEGNTYDTAYTVLEKINRAFNQTVFMYKGRWVIMRIEDLYVSSTTNISGVDFYAIGFPSPLTPFSTRFDIEVGINENVKPISPEMLRFIKRRTKKDVVKFSYTEFNEVVDNMTFQRGILERTSTVDKTYSLINWEFQRGSILSPTIGKYGGRRETFDANGDLSDNFVFLSNDGTNNIYMKSNPVYVLQNENASFSIDHRFATKVTGGGFTESYAVFRLYGVTNNYTLKEDGVWVQSNSTWTTNFQVISTQWQVSPYPDSDQWTTNEIDIKPFPETGTLYVYLMTQSTFPAGQEKWYKNLKLRIISRYNGHDNNIVKGIESIFTKNVDIKNNFRDEIFLDDGVSRVYKGTIYENDGVTPTNKRWYRNRYNTERLGFRKQNAVANWEHNSIHRNKIDVNFYGIKYDGTNPIGLLNTVKFVDDDPNRVYAIMNLREIDFSSNTWSATLVEIFDDTKDAGGGSGSITKNLNSSPTAGTYTGITKLPYTITSYADFTWNSTDNIFTFKGDTITQPFTCTVSGTINTVNPLSTNVTFALNINGVDVATQVVSAATTPQIFYVVLSGTYTINFDDILYVSITDNATSFDITTGQLLVSYTVPLDYDGYEDKYLYS